MVTVRRLAMAVFCVAALLAGPSRAAPELAVDVASGAVYFEREAGVPWHPASLTKLMTVYVTFRAMEAGEVSPETVVTVSPAATRASPSRMGFPAGTRMTLDAALKMLVVKSANDLGVAVAETVGGSVDGFVARMNAESAALGLHGSVWRNPHGLHHPEQVTTARDMAVLGRALLLRYPDKAGLFSLHGFTVGSVEVENHNGLIGRVEGADGMKTGYICASGFNIVATVTRGGRRMLAVVMGGRKAVDRDATAARLIESALLAPPLPLDVGSIPHAGGSPTDMTPFVCGGRKPPAGGDTEAVLEAKARWTRTFRSMPRTLGEPVRLGLLPPERVAPAPAPRPDLDALRTAWLQRQEAEAPEAEAATPDATVAPKPSVRRF